MTASETTDLLSALDRVLASSLPPEVAALGRRLRHRLSQPATIAILGNSESVQSSLSAILASDPRLAAVERTEITISDSSPPDHPAMALAAITPQLAIWCAKSFSAADLLRWSHVPQSLRDQSFLVLTVTEPPSAPPQTDRLADEFRDIFMLPSRPANGLASPHPSYTLATHAIAEAVLRQIVLGQDALRDNVDLFLSRYAAPSDASPLSALCSIHATLTRRAQDLILLRDLPAPDRATAILAHCTACIESIIPMATGRNGPLFDDILTAADSLILMQAEGGEAAATEALTLLLQLRREISESR